MTEPTRTRLDYPDIEAAAERITGRVRAVSVAAAQHGRRPEAETDTGATWVALPTADPAAAGLYTARVCGGPWPNLYCSNASAPHQRGIHVL